MVGAQLIERSLPTPEGPRFKSSHGKLLYRTLTCLLSTVLERRKLRKRGREWRFFTKIYFILIKRQIVLIKAASLKNLNHAKNLKQFFAQFNS